MPAVVVLASNLLFFEEQDNDTLKNLMTLPVSNPRWLWRRWYRCLCFPLRLWLSAAWSLWLLCWHQGWSRSAFGNCFCRHRTRDHDGVGALPCVLSSGAFEPQLHYLRNHHIFLHGGQLYFGYQRLFHHAALWVQSRYAVTLTSDLPLVLSVSGCIQLQRTDDGTVGTNQSLLL